MSLTNLIASFHEGVLNFVWRQWGQLGVFAPVGRQDRWVQDPEALMIFTLEVARTEPRIFDEVLDWLCVNGDAIMVHRVRNLLGKEGSAPRALVEAALARAGVHKPTASKDAGPPLEPVFPGLGLVDVPGAPLDEVFAAYGYSRPPFKGSGKSRPVPMSHPIALAFRFRAAFGASARSEALRFLTLRGAETTTMEIAEAAGLSRFAVQQALDELAAAGMIRRRLKGKRDLAWHAEESALKPWLADSGTPSLGWIAWPVLYDVLIELWRWLHDAARERESEYILASGARRLMLGLLPVLSGPDLPWRPRHPEEFPVAAYLPVFEEDLAAFLAWLDGGSSFRGGPSAELIAAAPFVATRMIDAAEGEVRGGTAAGQIVGLRFRWEAFGAKSTTFSGLEPIGGTSVLRGRQGKAGAVLGPDDEGTFEAKLQGERRFTISGASLAAYSVALGDGRIVRAELRHERATLTHFPAWLGIRPAWSRHILAGLRFSRWPHAILGPAGSEVYEAMRLEVQGRTIVLQQLSVAPDLVSVVIPDPDDFADLRQFVEDLARVLSFLQGAIALEVACERFASDGTLIEEAWIRTANPSRVTKLAPIDWGLVPDADAQPGSPPAALIQDLLRAYAGVREQFALKRDIGCLGAAGRLPVPGDIALRMMALRHVTTCWFKAMNPGAKRRPGLAVVLRAMGVPLDVEREDLIADLSDALEDGTLQTRYSEREDTLQEGVLARGALGTLANAAVLSVLGYRGPVIDYGVLGYPSIDIGGLPANDSQLKPAK